MSGLYARLRAICCRAWGVPPWAFDEAADAERIGFGAVAEELALHVFEAGDTGLFRYLWRERFIRRAQQTAKLQARLGPLLVAAKAARGNKAKQAEIIAEVRRVTQECRRPTRN